MTENTESTPQTLTLADVVREGMKAWVDGTLALSQGTCNCRYLEPTNNTRCVVGSALTPETLARVIESDRNAQAFNGLLDGGLVTFVGDKEDLFDVFELQAMHDCGDAAALHKDLTKHADTLGLTPPEGFRELAASL
jgi:hypothetical protein